MGTIHLVRHGQASAGTDDYDRLSERGEYQAGLLGLWWKQQGFAVDHAAFGTLKRQRDTARIALDSAGLKPSQQVHGNLDEYDHRLVETRYCVAAAQDNPESLNFSDYQAIMQRWRDATAGEAQKQTKVDSRNASITSLTHDGDQARLIEFNTVPHLQMQSEADLITLI